MDPIIRQIVGRCHVGESNMSVLRYAVSRLKHGRKTFLSMPKASRRKFMTLCIHAHAENRDLYRAVMLG